MWLYWICVAVVPLAAGLFYPRLFRRVVALGVVIAGIGWALAYRESQVMHGGDWQPGSELFAFTGILAVIVFAIWFILALIGTAAGRRWRNRH